MLASGKVSHRRQIDTTKYPEDDSGQQQPLRSSQRDLVSLVVGVPPLFFYACCGRSAIGEFFSIGYQEGEKEGKEGERGEKEKRKREKERRKRERREREGERGKKGGKRKEKGERGEKEEVVGAL
jgi:hypothetical protein